MKDTPRRAAALTSCEQTPGAPTTTAATAPGPPSARPAAGANEDVEAALRGRSPTDNLSHNRCFEDVEKAVRANLPIR